MFDEQPSIYRMTLEEWRASNEVCPKCGSRDGFDLLEPGAPADARCYNCDAYIVIVEPEVDADATD